jgi:transposase
MHLVALPAYSPELNPVELLWNQLKKELKNQQGRLSSIPEFEGFGRGSGEESRGNPE